FQEVAGSLTAHDIPNPSYHFFSQKRLRHKILSSRLQESHSNFLICLGSKQNDAYSTQFRPASDCRYHFLAANFGHHDVAQNQVRFVLERLLNTFLSIERGDHVVVAAQGIDDELIHVWVVFDDQYRPPLHAVRTICLDWELRRPQLLKH